MKGLVQMLDVSDTRKKRRRERRVGNQDEA